MEEGNNYTLYKHIFPNGKSYIGITKQDPEKRWRKGEGYNTQPKIYEAIKKYGWHSITHLIIAKNLYKDEAIKLEEALILADDTIVNGYNQSFGGYSNVSTQTNNKYFQIYNAFFGDGAFDEFLEKTNNNEDLLKHMIKFALKQGKIDNERPLQANIIGDIYQFRLLCDMFLAYRYLYINNGSKRAFQVVKEQAKLFDTPAELDFSHIWMKKQKWFFNPHSRAMERFKETYQQKEDLEYAENNPL